MQLSITDSELEYMHSWCLYYSAKVKRGEKPTDIEDEKFMLYQWETYSAGVAYGTT